MNKVLASSLLTAAFVLSPILVGAQTATSTNVSSMLQQIQALQAQIKAMQDLQNQLKTAQQNVQTSLGLIRNLKQGMSGDDVKALQAILASDPTIFPNGQITGFFGPLTAQAVKKFQKKKGLEQVGNVGPKTLNKLNEEFGKLGLSFEMGSSTATSSPFRRGDDDRGERNRPQLCVKIPPGQQIPQGWMRHDDDEDEGDDRGGREDNKGKMILVPCQGLPPQISPIPPQQATTSPVTPPTQPGFTMTQVSTHNTQNDCYSVVNGFVYNLTNWINQHPGGASAIIGMCGKDGTSSFMAQHGGQGNPAAELALFKIGVLIK